MLSHAVKNPSSGAGDRAGHAEPAEAGGRCLSPPGKRHSGSGMTIYRSRCRKQLIYRSLKYIEPFFHAGRYMGFCAAGYYRISNTALIEKMGGNVCGPIPGAEGVRVRHTWRLAGALRWSGGLRLLEAFGGGGRSQPYWLEIFRMFLYSCGMIAYSKYLLCLRAGEVVSWLMDLGRISKMSLNASASASASASPSDLEEESFLHESNCCSWTAFLLLYLLS
jgi:hypothetical protein